MGKQTKGKCKYCGRESTKAYMLKHLVTCKEREASIAAEKGVKKCGYFELIISGTYDKDYWLIIEIREDATLEDIDSFLRDIWLECCGHLSAFNIDGINYEAAPYDEFFGDKPKSMNYKLNTLLQKGMTFDYEYDFGSTTDIFIGVYDYRESFRKKEKLTILSRNAPPEIKCSECHTKTATVICAECIYDGSGFLCDDCKKTHDCGEDIQLDICNSPRIGVCAYEGSACYPEQFVPDMDKS